MLAQRPGRFTSPGRHARPGGAPHRLRCCRHAMKQSHKSIEEKALRAIAGVSLAQAGAQHAAVVVPDRDHRTGLWGNQAIRPATTRSPRHARPIATPPSCSSHRARCTARSARQVPSGHAHRDGVHLTRVPGAVFEGRGATDKRSPRSLSVPIGVADRRCYSTLTRPKTALSVAPATIFRCSLATVTGLCSRSTRQRTCIARWSAWSPPARARGLKRCGSCRVRFHARSQRHPDS